MEERDEETGLPGLGTDRGVGAGPGAVGWDGVAGQAEPGDQGDGEGDAPEEGSEGTTDATPQQPALSPAAIRATITLISLAVAVLAVMIFMPRVGMGAYVSRVCFALAFALFVAVIIVGVVARKPKGSDLAAVIAVAVVLSIPTVLMGGNAALDLPYLAHPQEVALSHVSVRKSGSTDALHGVDAAGVEYEFDIDDETESNLRDHGAGDYDEANEDAGPAATVTCLPHTKVLLQLEL